jgi:hypothetical protein
MQLTCWPTQSLLRVTFVAGVHSNGDTVSHVHVIWILSAVPGNPALVIRVIPGRKATAEVTTEIERIVGVLSANWLSVELVCTNGHSPYVGKLAPAFELLSVRGS